MDANPDNDTGEPALAFTSREFSFYPTAFLFCDHDFANCDGGVNTVEGPDWDDHNDDLVLGNRYFGKVSVRARDGDAAGVKFAVEGGRTPSVGCMCWQRSS